VRVALEVDVYWVLFFKFIFCLKKLFQIYKIDLFKQIGTFIIYSLKNS